MYQIQNLESSSLKYSQKSLLLGFYHNVLTASAVTVPVEIVSNQFVLDFEVRLKEVSEHMAELREETKRALLTKIVMTYDTIKPADLAAELQSMGLRIPAKSGRDSDSEELDRISDFVLDITQRISRQLTEGGLTNLMLKESLSLSSGLDFSAFADVDMSAVVSIVDKVHSFYGQFLNESKGDTLSEILVREGGTDGLLKAIRAFKNAFTTHKGMNVSVRESHVVDIFFQEVAKTPFIEKEVEVPGRCYRYTDINLPELNFAESLAGFMYCLNVSIGSMSHTDRMAEMKLADIVDTLVTGVGTVLPFAPKEAGHIDTNRLNSHFRMIYLMNMLRRVLRDDNGEFYQRVFNQIKSNSYFKFDASSAPFYEELSVLSIAYESFRDTAFYFRHMFTSSDIRFNDDALHHRRRSQITDFVEERIKDLAKVIVPMESPRFYKTAQHVLASTASMYLQYPMMPEVLVPSNQTNRVTRYAMSTEMTSYLSVATSGLLRGSWYDVAHYSRTSLPPSVLAKAAVVEPLFYVYKDFEGDILTSQAVRAKYRFMPLDEMLRVAARRDDVSELLTSVSQTKFAASVDILAREMGLPLELAQVIYDDLHGRGPSVKTIKKNGDASTKNITVSGYYADLGDSARVFYLVNPKTFGIYQVIEAPDDQLEVPPIVARYPMLLTEVVGQSSSNVIAMQAGFGANARRDTVEMKNKPDDVDTEEQDKLLKDTNGKKELLTDPGIVEDPTDDSEKGERKS